MKIEKLKTILNTDVMRQGYIAYADLIAHGNSPGNGNPFHPDSEAIYARDEDGMIVAMLIWKVYDQDPTDAWIALAWVAPHRRREGLYRRMLATLHAECVERKLRRIELGVMAKNKTMQQCQDALGFQMTQMTYRMEMPRTEEAQP